MKQITKILTLGILFFLAFSMQLSAQKCKYDFDKKDPITGETTKKNTVTISISPYYWKLGYSRTGDNFQVEMFIRCNGNLREIIQKGDPIILKLSNDEIITVYSKDEFLPFAQTSSSQTATRVLSTYNGKYDIDATSLQKIAENPPTFIRMNIESKVYEKEISAKDGKILAKAAACILQ